MQNQAQIISMKNILCVFILGVSFLNLESQINAKWMDMTVRPQDDIYTHVNGNWMKTIEIPSDKTRWGSFDELRDITEKNSLVILKDIVAKSHPEGSDAKKLKDFYETILAKDKASDDINLHLRYYLEFADKISSPEVFKKYLKETTKQGRNPFFNIYVNNHQKKSGFHALYVGAAQLGLGRDYYQKNDERTLAIIDAYKKYIKTLVLIVNPNTPNGDVIAQDIYQLEKSLAQNMMSLEDSRKPELRDNPVAFADIPNLSSYSGVQSSIQEYVYRIDTVYFPELNYFKMLDQTIQSRNPAVLSYFLKFKLLDQSMTLLSKKYDSIHFDFYGKVLRGQKTQQPEELRALQLINSTYGEILGKYYVKKHFPPQAKSQALEMIGYIRYAFADHIQGLKWMSEPTKKKALEKLSKITVKIGYPDKWQDYKNYEVKSISQGGSLYSNYMAFSTSKFVENIGKINKPVDKSEWRFGPQTVNAFYNSLNNEIVFPAGIMQAPFYDYKANPAVNFGGIGAVIGHEITHGFDDGGSKYDGDGKLHNWWTQEDRNQFEKASEALVDQYSACEPIPGVKLNGKYTLGENIADHGGVAVAFDAMKAYLKAKKGLKFNPTPYTPEQEFFYSWSTIWRTKMNEKELVNRIKTDTHAPGNYRATIPLTNSNAYHDVFKVSPNDKMYKKENERIKIW